MRDSSWHAPTLYTVLFSWLLITSATMANRKWSAVTEVGETDPDKIKQKAFRLHAHVGVVRTVPVNHSG